MTPALKSYLLARAKEASTWQSIVGLAALAGCHFAPDQVETMISTGVLLAGVIGAAMPDKIGGGE